MLVSLINALSVSVFVRGQLGPTEGRTLVTSFAVQERTARGVSPSGPGMVAAMSMSASPYPFAGNTPTEIKNLRTHVIGIV